MGRAGDGVRRGRAGRDAQRQRTDRVCTPVAGPLQDPAARRVLSGRTSEELGRDNIEAVVARAILGSRNARGQLRADTLPLPMTREYSPLWRPLRQPLFC